MRALSMNSSVSGTPGASSRELDVRSRMFVTLLASMVAIAVSSFAGQAVLFFASFFYVLSIRRYRALFLAYVFLVFMMLLAAFFTWALSRALASMPFSLQELAVPFLRGAVMLNVVLPIALTCRIQALLTALKGLHLPFCVYLPGAVMIRFIPTFMEDIKQVSETLKIRGYDLSIGEMFRRPLRMLRLLFTPLLFRSLRSSEELGIAAELKGLDADGASGRFVPFRASVWTRRDTLLVLLAITAAALALCCQIRWGGAFAHGMR